MRMVSLLVIIISSAYAQEPVKSSENSDPTLRPKQEINSGDFIPTEEISDDLPVAFPVDI